MNLQQELVVRSSCISDAHLAAILGYGKTSMRHIGRIRALLGDPQLGLDGAGYDFRYSNRSALEYSDEDRAEKALKGIQGKRLTYRRTNEARHA